MHFIYFSKDITYKDFFTYVNKTEDGKGNISNNLNFWNGL